MKEPITQEEKRNIFIKKTLFDNGFIHKTEEEPNLIHAEKAFIASAVLRDGLIKLEQKKIQPQDLNTYFYHLDQYKNNFCEFEWKENGDLLIKQHYIIQKGDVNENKESQEVIETTQQVSETEPEPLPTA